MRYRSDWEDDPAQINETIKMKMIPKLNLDRYEKWNEWGAKGAGNCLTLPLSTSATQSDRDVVVWNQSTITQCDLQSMESSWEGQKFQ
jgi:hypothetical protein